MTYTSTHPLAERRAIPLPDPRALRAAVVVCIAYYLGARLGFALTLRPYPISTLWPPNSILLAALLLTPVSWWWLVLLGAVPAHLAVELSSGVPPAMAAGWFVSNSSEALLGAGIMRQLLKGAPRFDRSRDVGVFVCAVFLAVSLSGILDAG
ncbi:MAG TPA: MASE1 domain-containing protein, partial [Gemmatimonadales bacterium]